MTNAACPRPALRRCHASPAVLSALLSLALSAGGAEAKKPPPPAAPAAPDCSACGGSPSACKDIKRCMKSCGTPGSVAYECFKQKRITQEAYTAATGREPDDFDAIVDDTKVAPPAEAKPGASLPDILTMDQIKKGMGKVDFAPCVKEGNVKPGETATAMIKLTIEKDGKVSEAGSPQNNALTRCVIPKAKTATFPPFGGMPMKLTYPVIVRAPQ